jgi:hypothetical protein
MKSSRTLALFLLAAASLIPAAASAQSPYTLRDTTSFPPPKEGMARLLVARERFIDQGLKPEFVVIDTTAIGQLPQKSGVAAEIPAGWHRLWLARGTKAGMWMEFAPGGRYLIRLRENVSDMGGWRADLVRDDRDGYAEFAVSKGMQLAVATQAGLDAIRRDIKKRMPTAKTVASERDKAQKAAQLPIVIEEAWYLDLLDESDKAQEFEQHLGKLTLDATVLKYTRDDGVVVEIPRSTISEVRYGGHRRNMPNPWIKIAYTADGAEKAVAFAATDANIATGEYNRLFAELEKGLPQQ